MKILNAKRPFMFIAFYCGSNNTKNVLFELILDTYLLEEVLKS